MADRESISATDFAALSVLDKAALDWQLSWRATARDNQLPPQGNWSVWGVIAGRGFGKTRVGAEWIAAPCGD